MQVTSENIACAAAFDKTQLRDWISKHLSREMLDNLFELIRAGLAEPTPAFYDNVLSRDGFSHRDRSVLVYPSGDGGWLLFESNDGGGGIQAFRSKSEAVDVALELVKRDNAELRISNQIFLSDEEWGAFHGF